MSVEDVLEQLRAFQIARLEETYRDLEQHQTLKPLGQFFIHELYGRRDPPGRDETVKRVYKTIEDRLGVDVVSGLRRLLRLYRITKEMDRRVAELLEPALRGKPIAMEGYEEAYRAADQYELRKEQIDLIVEAIQGVHRLARTRGIGKGLKAFSWVAGPLGARPLVDFLTRGWQAFHAVEDISLFVGMIRDRETRRLDRIYGRG